MSTKSNYDKVVGIKKFTSKQGNPCCMIVLLRPCTENQNKYGTYGFYCKEEFVPENLHDKVTTNLIGCEVELVLGATINQYGQARVVIEDIVVKN